MRGCSMSPATSPEEISFINMFANLKRVDSFKIPYKKRYAFSPHVQGIVGAKTDKVHIPIFSIEKENDGFQGFEMKIYMPEGMSYTRDNYNFNYEIIGNEGQILEQGEIKE